AELNQFDGMLLVAQGRFIEAVERMERALKQEPLSLAMMCTLADAYGFARQFDDAVAQYDKVLELDPNYRRAYEGKGYVELARGNTEGAIRKLEKYQQMIGDITKGLAGLGYAYGIGGYPEKARECLNKTLERQRNNPGVQLILEFVLIYTGLGEYDKAFEYLAKACEEKSG